MFLLKPFEPPGPPPGIPAPAAAPAIPSQAAAAAAIVAQLPSRGLALRVIGDIAVNGQLLVDLFVNFDCDLESSNLFERIVAVLVRVVSQVDGGGKVWGVLLGLGCPASAKSEVQSFKTLHH